jgi:hypothetical protein
LGVGFTVGVGLGAGRVVEGFGAGVVVVGEGVPVGVGVVVGSVTGSGLDGADVVDEGDGIAREVTGEGAAVPAPSIETMPQPVRPRAAAASPAATCAVPATPPGCRPIDVPRSDAVRDACRLNRAPILGAAGPLWSVPRARSPIREQIETLAPAWLVRPPSS